MQEHERQQTLNFGFIGQQNLHDLGQPNGFPTKFVPNQPLRHGLLGHEKDARDLGCGNSGNGSQG
jgi:hypothetical protein